MNSSGAIHGLGMATYSLADRSITHQQYMRSVSHGFDASHYAGFFDDPLDAFRHALLDLEQYGRDFLNGTDECLLRRVDQASETGNTKSGPPK
jgi:hypothetical protein